eukprot:1134776-Pelagomonas_calceolata.AAC.6
MASEILNCGILSYALHTTKMERTCTKRCDFPCCVSANFAFTQAIHHIRQFRKFANPNAGFLEQLHYWLVELEGRLDYLEQTSKYHTAYREASESNQAFSLSRFVLPQRLAIAISQ